MQFLKIIPPNQQKEEQSVIGAILPQIGKKVPSRPFLPIHASDLTKAEFCPREVALLDYHGMSRPPEYLPPALRVTFDAGRLTEKLVREFWLGDAAYGEWRCARCNHQWSGLRPKPKKCLGCQTSDLIEYRELRFEHPETGASGSIDVLVKLGNQKLTVVELKIMSQTEFDTVVAPLAEHRERTSLYLRLIEESNCAHKDMIRTDEARVLYVSRGHGKKNDQHDKQILPFKEFVVTRQDPPTEKYLAKAREIRAYQVHKIMPFGLCKTVNDPRSKSCSVKTLCMGGGFLPGQKCG